MSEHADWTARVEALLAMGEHGTVVLVDGAHDSHIGDLVRRLVVRWPELDYVMDASELRDAKESTTLILDVPDDDSAIAELNLVRSALRDRHLRVVIWARDGMSARLSRAAPDFFDWISHRVETPAPRPWPSIVRTLLAAEQARRPIWWGHSIDELRDAVSCAWPGRGLVVVNTVNFDRAVDEILGAGDRFVVAEGASIEATRWAIAESRRESGVAMRIGARSVNAPHPHPGYWAVTAQAWTSRDLMRRELRRARVRLCMLDLEVAHLTPVLLGEALSSGPDPAAALEAEPTDWAEIAHGWARNTRLRRWGTDPRALKALQLSEPEDQLAAIVITRGQIEGHLAIPAEIERALWRGDLEALPTIAMLAAELGEFDAAIRWDRRRGAPPQSMRVQKASSRLVLDGPVAAMEALVISEPPADGVAQPGRWHALHARVLADLDALDGAQGELARAGVGPFADATSAYVNVVRGAFRTARAAIDAVTDHRTLTHVEIGGLLAASWACDHRPPWLTALHAAQPHELDVAWRPWLALLLGNDPPAARRRRSALAAATIDYTHAETALMRGSVGAAVAAAARCRWRLDSDTPSREHHLAGFAELVRGRALARLGQRERAAEALLVASGIIKRTTGNASHPFVLVAQVEREWLAASVDPESLAKLDGAVSALEEELWSEHREVRAAAELRHRLA